jgi:hypothetical protein
MAMTIVSGLKAQNKAIGAMFRMSLVIFSAPVPYSVRPLATGAPATFETINALTAVKTTATCIQVLLIAIKRFFAQTKDRWRAPCT